MIAADSTCHTCGDGDNHQLRVAVFKYGDNNGDQDSEGSPGGSGGKCQETPHDKDDGRQEVDKPAGAAFHQPCHVYVGSQAVGHGL